MLSWAQSIYEGGEHGVKILKDLKGDQVTSEEV